VIAAPTRSRTERGIRHHRQENTWVRGARYSPANANIDDLPAEMLGNSATSAQRSAFKNADAELGPSIADSVIVSRGASARYR
jgi:hypothetical protein